MTKLPDHLQNYLPVPVTDAEREAIERQAKNFHDLTGKRMRLPPLFIEALRDAGVDTKNMEPDESIAHLNPTAKVMRKQ